MVSDCLRKLENAGIMATSNTVISLRNDFFDKKGEELTVIISQQPNSMMTLVSFLALPDVPLGEMGRELANLRPKPIAALMYDGVMDALSVEEEIPIALRASLVRTICALCKMDEGKERRLLELLEDGKQLIFVNEMISVNPKDLPGYPG